MLRLFRSVDPILFATLVVLVIGGVFIFLSASLGLLAQSNDRFSDVAVTQLGFGLGGGIVAFLVGLITPYRFWRRIAFYLFGGALILTAMVFVPGIGFEYNGAQRWLAIGSFTVQPSEFLKVAYIIVVATWFSTVKAKMGQFRFGLLPFAGITGLAGIILLLQPDTDTFAVIAASGMAMFFAAGAKWRDIGIVIGVAFVGLIILMSFRPYLMERVTTFLNPSNDPQGAGYQIKQSLLAIGAGELTGRGFGKSIQKFGKLPEPTSDSIFSVFAEEFGFLGSTALVSAFLVFALRGFWIAARAPDLFGALLATGIVVFIASESFLNIGAMLGLFPLSGLPLVFVSHGGTALMTALGASGILLSVSRYAKTR